MHQLGCEIVMPPISEVGKRVEQIRDISKEESLFFGVELGIGDIGI